MRWFFDNIPVVLVAMMVAVIGWLFGGTRSDVLISTVPWLMLFLLETIIAFPQKASGETSYEARVKMPLNSQL